MLAGGFDRKAKVDGLKNEYCPPKDKVCKDSIETKYAEVCGPIAQADPSKEEACFNGLWRDIYYLYQACPGSEKQKLKCVADNISGKAKLAPTASQPLPNRKRLFEDVKHLGGVGYWSSFWGDDKTDTYDEMVKPDGRHLVCTGPISERTRYDYNLSCFSYKPNAPDKRRPTKLDEEKRELDKVPVVAYGPSGDQGNLEFERPDGSIVSCVRPKLEYEKIPKCFSYDPKTPKSRTASFELTLAEIEQYKQSGEEFARQLRFKWGDELLRLIFAPTPPSYFRALYAKGRCKKSDALAPILGVHQLFSMLASPAACLSLDLKGSIGTSTVRAKPNPTAITIEGGWTVASRTSLVQFLGLPNDPNLPDLVFYNKEEQIEWAILDIDPKTIKIKGVLE